jgi:lipoprotein NlpI
VRFYSGMLAKAEPDFAKAAALAPDNAYLAIWLDIIDRRSGGTSHLREAAAKLDMSKWPAPVIKMLLGQKTSAEALADAITGDPVQTSGQVCEANFYTAELDRLQARNKEAVRLYRLAARTCPKGYIEYRGAVAGLRALGMLP